MKKTLIFMTLCAVILTACVPGQTPQQTQDQINTAVAAAIATQQALIDQAVAATLTAVAQNASPTPVAPTLVVPATSTPLSFPTLTPVIPTVTPVPVIPPSGGGGVPAKREYACTSIGTKPKDYTEFHKGDDFDIKWTIVNIGTKTWDAGVDVKYLSGPQMSYAKIVEIPVAMKPNDQYTIVLDAAAPTSSGDHIMTWVVQGPMCYVYVAIRVK
jgi:type II secretory pathway pseudopilin PulG